MVFASIVLLVVLIVVSSIMFYQHQGDVYDALEQRIDIARSRNSSIPGFPGLPLSSIPGQAFGNRVPLDPEMRPNEPRESAGDQFVATALFVLDEDDNLVAAYDEAFPIEAGVLDTALSLALEEMDEAGERGVHGVQGAVATQNLYYRIEPYQHGHLVAFASGNYIDRNMRGLLMPLVTSEAAALVAFLIVSIMLARWIVRPVEEAWNQQQQFIADASHELKTPLTVIRANDSILLAQPDATIESQTQWIESTETEAQIMQDLVNDMLYLAKADAAQIPLEYSTVNLSDIADMQLLQFESVAFERDIDMHGDIEKGIEVLGDASRLQRLIGTLLDNACKYVDEGGQVFVRLKQHGSLCSFTVRNTGTPIDPEDLPHLFDRFYRSDKARTRAHGGYGLGLSIAKSITEDHGGTIKVTSTQSDGTTFRFELPLAK